MPVSGRRVLAPWLFAITVVIATFPHHPALVAEDAELAAEYLNPLRDSSQLNDTEWKVTESVLGLPEELPPATSVMVGYDEPSEPDGMVPDMAGGSEQDRSSDSGRAQGADRAVIERGRTAFETSCTVCHDADRALQKRKTRAGWLATIRRMSQMDGADIDPGDFGPIATYLASLNEPEDRDEEADAQDDGDAVAAAAEAEPVVGSGLSFGGTISTIWRGGNDNLEKPNFFPDVWLRADWQPSGPLRGRVTACTSCHSEEVLGGGGFTFELVEGFAYYDLMHHHKERAREHGCKAPELEAGIEAGRFVVPFGAFSAMSHPGIYRTVTVPLMFNMGRRVGVDPTLSRPPVLPMPYADEGVNFTAEAPLCCDWRATLDVYAVNGLRGFGPGVRFTPSRSYTDNNSNPAVGGRATVGNGSVRIGGSVMSGEMQDESAPRLDYQFAGGDATFRWEDLVRLYFEYAIRRNDSALPRGQIAYGVVVEGEFLLLSKPKISLVTRYDTLEHRDGLGVSTVERFTWGVNTTVFGGSLLMINHERWNFRTPQPDVDVIGARWVATF